MKWEPIQTAPDHVPVLVTGFNYNQPMCGRHYVVAKKINGCWMEEREEGSEELEFLTHWASISEPPQ